MRTRTKVRLAYPALIVLVLAMINFGMFAVNGTAPVPVFVSHPIGMVAGAYLVFAFVLPGMFGRQGPSLVFGIGITGYAVFLLLRGAGPFVGIMAAFGLVAIFQCARELIRLERRE
jgi:hypothetical protein